MSNVKHPNHYNWIPGIEAIDVAKWFTFNLGNVLKYIWRVPYKQWAKDDEGAIEDLQKARYYIDLEIERLGGPNENWEPIDYFERDMKKQMAVLSALEDKGPIIQ